MNSLANVLVVEDLHFWQDALAEILTEAGFHVRIAASYDKAIQALAQDAFRLAVIDPVLDDANRRNRDGLRVLQYLLERQPDMHAVVVTSSDPHRIRSEIADMSPDIPLLWKDEWDDDRFLSIVSELMGVRRH